MPIISAILIDSSKVERRCAMCGATIYKQSKCVRLYGGGVMRLERKWAIYQHWICCCASVQQLALDTRNDRRIRRRIKVPTQAFIDFSGAPTTSAPF